MGSKKTDKPDFNISIAGDNSGIVAGRDVIINQAQQPRQKVRAVVAVTEEHLSDQQRFDIKRLVDDIVKLEASVRQKPKGYPAVWNSLKARFRVSEYKLIPRCDYQEAEKYLRSWIGRLSSMKTAPKKDVNWRKRKLAFIHTNCKKYDLEPKMREFINHKFGAVSLAQLTDDDLIAVYNAVSRWKAAK